MAGFDLNSILNVVSGDGVSALAKSAKADEDQVSSLVSAAVPILIGKMQDNTAKDGGAASLGKALREHAGDDISDVGSFLTNADSTDGKKILGHILGDDQAAVTKALSKKSGLKMSQTTKILIALAPLLLTLLGNNKKDEDDSALGGLLGGLLGSNSSSGLGSALLGALLSGSGSSSSSSASSGLLGSLLGGSGSSSSGSSSSSLLGGLFGNLLGGSSNDEEEEKEESKPALGGLASLAMNLFGDSEALEDKKEETSGKKKKKTTSSKKKTTAKKTESSTSKKKTTTTKKTGSTTKKTTTSKKTSGK